MQTDFDTAEDFLEEVRAQKEFIDNALIRVQVSYRQSGALDSWSIRAGFTMLGELMQYREDCGVTPSAPGEPDGEAVARAIEVQLRTEIAAIGGLTVRKGMVVG